MNARLDTIAKRAFVVGIVALAVCLAAAFANPQQLFRSYLAAYLFWIGFPLGALALLMLHHLVGGRWGFVIQRLLEAAVRTLPLMAILFLPLLIGMRQIYPWASATAEHSAEAGYLNPAFFIVRAALYFAVWIGLALLLVKWSHEQDRVEDASLVARLQSVSGPGLVAYVLTVTFSAIDWAMSLEPEWYSTIYGLIYVVGYGLAALAFAIVAARLLADEKPLSGVADPDRFHDLGNLLLAFVMFWAYIAFSQFLIIWSENLREEIPWYIRRTAGGWRIIAVALIVLQFALPFLLLLSRAAKRRAHVLALVALLVLVMHWVDVLWLVAPAFHGEGFYFHWIDIAALAALGGIWIAAFVFYLRQRSLLPLNDPRFAEIVRGMETV